MARPGDYSQLLGAFQPRAKWQPGQEPQGLRTFGARLRKIRQEQGLTQAELAVRIGAGSRTIMRLEAGQTLPDVRRVCQLAGALGVDVVWLVHGE